MFQVVESKDHSGYFVARKVTTDGRPHGGYVSNPNPTGPKNWLFKTSQDARAAAVAEGLDEFTGNTNRSYASPPDQPAQ